MTLYVPGQPVDFFFEVGRGRIPGYHVHSVFGDNADVDGDEDVWSGGGLWVAPTSAVRHNVVSTDTADTTTGTGMRKVFVHGLDAEWNEISETVELNGTTNVLTANRYIRINHADGISFGSGETNAGVVTMKTNDGATTTTVHCPIGASGSEQCIYSIPAGHTANLIAAGAGIHKTGASGTASLSVAFFVRAYADQSDAGWRRAWVGGLVSGGTSMVNFERRPYAALPGKTDAKIRVFNVSTTNVNVSAWFDIVIVDDD